MYKFVVLSFVAVLAFQAVTAKPKGKQTQEPSGLQQLAANTQNVVNNVTSVLQGNLPDSKDIVKSLNENAQTLANHVQDVVNKLKTEVKNHQGDIDDVIKQISEKLTETKNSLDKALGPDGQKKAQEIKAKLEKGLKDAAAEAEKLTKAIEPEANKVKTDLTNAAKTFLDQIVDVSQNLQKQVAAIEKKN